MSDHHVSAAKGLSGTVCRHQQEQGDLSPEEVHCRGLVLSLFIVACILVKKGAC